MYRNESNISKKLMYKTPYKRIRSSIRSDYDSSVSAKQSYSLAF